MTTTGKDWNGAHVCWAGERGLRQENGTGLDLLKPECSPFLQTPRESGKREARLLDVLVSTRSTCLPFLDPNTGLESGARDSEGMCEVENPTKMERSSPRAKSEATQSRRQAPTSWSPSCGCTVSAVREVGPRLQPRHETSRKAEVPIALAAGSLQRRLQMQSTPRTRTRWDRLGTVSLSPSPRDLSAELRLPKTSWIFYIYLKKTKHYKYQIPL